MESKNLTFDRTILMSRVLNDIEVYREIIQLYIEDANIQLSNLKEAIDKKEPNEIRQLAHRIKGASANIGATKMQNCCYEIENFGKNQQIDQAQAKWNELEKYYRELITILNKEIES